MMTPIEERDKALSVIDPFMLEISLVYRECYLSEGKGALLVYADSVINGNIPAESDYTTKNDVLEIIFECSPVRVNNPYGKHQRP